MSTFLLILMLFLASSIQGNDVDLFSSMWVKITDKLKVKQDKILADFSTLDKDLRLDNALLS
jgi:hypothetical protein